MILEIDTSKYNKIILAALLGDKREERELKVDKSQSEKLLPLVDDFLKELSLEKKDIEKIRVQNRGGSFTSLRIGVVTANTMAYALGVPVCDFDGKSIDFDNINMVEAKYSREADINI